MSSIAALTDPAISAFGEACKAKLAGPGDREAAIRTPLETLLGAYGAAFGLKTVFHDEVRDVERHVRPDYGVSVNGAITGYVEVKAPGKSINPTEFTGHDKKQWERQRDLPNLLYTNGTDWRLYRDSELLAGPISLSGGPLEEAGSALSAPATLEALLVDFLKWKPAPITSVAALVRAVAPLTRVLRGEVLDQLDSEGRKIREGGDKDAQPFLGLAQDWRALLFPNADSETFADGYAQSVTFGLLLARTEGIDLEGSSLHTVGKLLGAEHSLMGKALQLLTDDVAADFKVTLDLLVRVIGAVDWPRVRKGRRDTYLHLYENFLELYDKDLRKASGSYYTPREVVDEMTRLTEEVLVSHLGKATGFRDPQVLTVDPAMGTGTFLHTILERVAKAAEEAEGPGSVPGAVSQAAERIVGFEIQMGPYAVAELRAHDLLALYGAKTPKDGLKLFVTDTLDDPLAEETQLGSGLNLLAKARRDANRVKSGTNVTVVIGNPPYKELAAGQGGWVESGSPAHDGEKKKKRSRAILEDFFSVDMSRYKAKLKNLYIYFWRWATWKTWESTVDHLSGDAGIVCFISTSGYVAGRPFTAMRKYLREQASDGWIIDLTPEGQTPDIPTRVFPGVRQPLCIGIFVRKPQSERSKPAVIRHIALKGKQTDKFKALSELTLDSPEWRTARSTWTAPFTPAALNGWDDHPALDDILPWYSPGIFATRTWIYAPAAEILKKRWAKLIAAPAPEKPKLFKEGSEPRLNKSFPVLPGSDTSKSTLPLAQETDPVPTEPVQIGYRAFDRQWIIPDNRAIHRSAAALWAARLDGQAFAVELHTKVLKPGPGIVFSALVPDYDHFKGSEGGRVLPALHPDGTANIAPGLAKSLTTILDTQVNEADVVPYVAALTSHAAYTATFSDELQTPGVRVPFTADQSLWRTAVQLGQEVIWAQTYGSSFTSNTRSKGAIRFDAGDPRRITATSAITSMPESISFDLATGEVKVGDGSFGPVSPEVWDFTVGGKRIVSAWFSSRKKNPGGLKLSPLDSEFVETWDPTWTSELIDLLSVLTRLIALNKMQAELLAKVMASPLISKDAMASHGTQWPEIPRAAKPRFPVQSQESSENAAQGVFNLGESK
ncbi:type ISP restriction/modification enzyme [Arthrobacter sp. M2012083]|uniref:type ISP restriction/modification enzyme n=1 Tax=Arthrobacter sp. M2012083 TaxID=1197706 RepID=UPI0002E53519|nr:type ISP restriction/modification enzyme [Arthrobacter sp. M2012083]